MDEVSEPVGMVLGTEDAIRGAVGFPAAFGADVRRGNADQVTVDVKRFDRDERRQIGGGAAAANAQVRALGAKRRVDAKLQVSELDVAVELIRERFDDSVPEYVRRQGNIRDEDSDRRSNETDEAERDR